MACDDRRHAHRALFWPQRPGPVLLRQRHADPSLAIAPDPEGGAYCYDPTNSYKGPHAYPYRYQIWAYDLNDFAAVKAGTKQPWDVVPYGVWPLELPTPESTTTLGGVATTRSGSSSTSRN